MQINLDAWEKLPAQDIFYGNNHTDILTFSGGLGSGKTHVLCRKSLQLSALNKDYPGGFLVPTYSDFRRDVKPELEFILEEKLGLIKKKHWDFHATHKEYRFCWSKAPMYILTGEKPIAGPNLAYCLINEFSLIQYERIKEMLRRVRVKGAPYKQKAMAGTPEDIHGWLEEFIETQEELNNKRPNNFKILFANTDENTFIDENYGESLVGILDEDALRVFKEGKIGSFGSDKFYYAYDPMKNVQECKYQPGELVHVGMDFNVGKMTASCAHVRNNTGKKRIEIFDEYFLVGESNTEMLGNAVKSKYGTQNVIITCDRAGNNRKTTGIRDVEMLKQLGFKVRFKSSNPRLRDRQIMMNGLFTHEQIIIDPSCRKTRNDFKNVRQDKKSWEKIKDKDDKLTHLSDGVDYLCDWEFDFALRTKNKTVQL